MSESLRERDDDLLWAEDRSESFMMMETRQASRERMRQERHERRRRVLILFIVLACIAIVALAALLAMQMLGMVEAPDILGAGAWSARQPL